MIFRDDLNEVSAEVIEIEANDRYIVRIANDANNETYAILHFRSKSEAIQKAKSFCGCGELEFSA